MALFDHKGDPCALLSSPRRPGVRLLLLQDDHVSFAVGNSLNWAGLDILHDIDQGNCFPETCEVGILKDLD